jgi:hypothetical protein
MQRERVVRREHVEPRCARAVPDKSPRSDQRRGVCDLRVGNTQQDRIGASRVSAPSERSEYEQAGLGQCRGKRAAEASATNHREAGTGRDVGGGVPFQFSHRRYRSA